MLLCAFTIVSASSVCAVPSAGISVSAESAILIEAKSGRVLYEKNAHERRGIASTTKILTALVTLENSLLEQRVRVTEKTVGIEGSSIYLHKGEVLTMEDLLYAMLLESANDAAATIALEVGGSIEGFADMMNAKVSKMGLSDSSFANPHGLDADGHYSTAYDLALITAEALKNESFRRIVSTYRKVIENTEENTSRLLLNHNKLLKTYDGAVGVKTGFTKRCGRCLVSAAKRDGLILIAVTLNAPDDWNDHKRMLDFGFSNYENCVLLEDGEIRLGADVAGGDIAMVPVSNKGALCAFLPRERGEISYVVELRPFYYAPVFEDQELGNIRYYCDGECIAETKLYATESVFAKKTATGFWALIRRLFGF